MSVQKQSKSKPGNNELAKRRAPTRTPFLHTDGKYLSREEVYDRERIQEKK